MYNTCCHPGEGRGLVRAKRIYKLVYADECQTPAFAGVVNTERDAICTCF